MNPRDTASSWPDLATSPEQAGNFSRNKIWCHDAWDRMLCVLDIPILKILFKFASPSIKQVTLKQISQHAYYEKLLFQCNRHPGIEPRKTENVCFLFLKTISKIQNSATLRWHFVLFMFFIAPGVQTHPTSEIPLAVINHDTWQANAKVLNKGISIWTTQFPVTWIEEALLIGDVLRL